MKIVQPVQFVEGYNDLLLLSETVGLQVKITPIAFLSITLFNIYIYIYTHADIHTYIHIEIWSSMALFGEFFIKGSGL